ncbi:MAG: DUF3592 domain-containing protein [Desulfobacterales bacterium]|nr:DUF3592 domain-containing protein [Desulfobacterales bacterium]
MEQLGEVITGAMDGDAESILLIFALYFLMMCAFSVRYQLRMKAWPKTRGKLLHSRMEHVAGFEWDPADKLYATDAIYEYQVDGKIHQGKKVSPWVMVASHNARFVLQKQLSRIEVGPGNEVCVYYNPNKPSQAVLIKPSNLGIAVTVLFALFPLALYLTF